MWRKRENHIFWERRGGQKEPAPYGIIRASRPRGKTSRNQMTYAILSDIHANEIALSAVLADARRHPAPPVEVPVRTIYLDGNASSHYLPLRDTFITQLALWGTLFRRNRQN